MSKRMTPTQFVIAFDVVLCEPNPQNLEATAACITHYRDLHTENADLLVALGGVADGADFHHNESRTDFGERLVRVSNIALTAINKARREAMSTFIKVHETVYGRSRLVRVSEIIMLRPEVASKSDRAILVLQWGSRVEELTTRESFIQLEALLTKDGTKGD